MHSFGYFFIEAIRTIPGQKIKFYLYYICSCSLSGRLTLCVCFPLPGSRHINMNECFRMKICMLVLLFGQSQAGLAEEREMSQPVRLAVGPVDPEGGRPSCEADSICRINECSNDPDCPRDLPIIVIRPGPRALQTHWTRLLIVIAHKRKISAR